jgi:hypothetical protein
MHIHTQKPQSLDYAVADDSKVTVRVVVGDAQGGGWHIDLDDVSLGKGGEPVEVPIGDGKAIRGKELQIVVSAVDIQPATNRLSATVTLDGGKNGKKSVEQRYDEGSDGDLAIFTTLIDFT